MLTVRDALDTLLDYAGEAADSEARRVGLALLNDAIEAIASAHDWLDHRSPTPFELTTTAGASRYALPAQVRSLHEPARNLTRPGVPLTTIDLWDATAAYPRTGLVDAERGIPRRWRLSGITGVARQPDPSGTLLEIASNDPADTNVSVTLRGDGADGHARTVRVALTGITPVAVGAWTFLDEMGKASTAVTPTPGLSSAGTVTLRRVDTGVALQTLAPDEAGREHKVLQLYPTPDAAYALAFPFQRRAMPLVAGSDALPSDWWLAIKEEWEIRWRVNTGEVSADSMLPRPHLARLIEEDNLLRPAPRKRPMFGGGARG